MGRIMKLHFMEVNIIILSILVIIKLSEGTSPVESHYNSYTKYEDSKSYPHHEPHYGIKDPYHEPQKSHYETKDPYHEQIKIHHEPHYEPEDPFDEQTKSHIAQHYGTEDPYHESHYKPKDPYHEPPKPHYETKDPYHEPTKSHHEQHYETKDPYHEPQSYEDSDNHYDKNHNPDCLDISTYGELTYERVEKQHCTLQYKKHIAKKNEKVCNTVTSLKPCTVLPFTECHMTLKDEKTYSCELFWKFGTVRHCANITKTVEHYKKKPKCTKKPKYHCRERWEINKHGKKIWAGTKDCKLVEWEDCVLETKKVKFHYIQPDCSGKKPVPLHDIRSHPEVSVTSTLKCYVKKTAPCVQDIRQKCRNIYYTETVITPETKCQTLEFWVPNQKRHHEQKCLFENDEKQSLPTNPLKDISPGHSPHVPIKPENVSY